ncbi:MAG: serine/threonine protein kinase [Tannerellaceae bacterium]|jgi:serine/threonine protein kinase|nr:serine/threonine protein kinase [Tannerellaceae bacterium]
MKAPDDFSKALPAGATLRNGTYRIKQVLGSGGFGVTYLTTWIQTQKTGLKEIKTGEATVVVKEFYHKMYCFRNAHSNEIVIANEEKRREFNRLKRKLISEARIMNTFTHPNIVEVYDAFEENNTAYIVMAYIDSTDLDALISRQGRIETGDTLKYMIEIASALETVHQHNILHLDISPSNILIDKNNRALLIDFGISLSYDDAGDVKLTSKLLTGRKQSFSPLEQSSLEILAKFVPSIDMYALGATFYNCLTGEEPPEASTLASGYTLLKKPSSFSKTIPPALDKIVFKAMSLNRKERYQTATEFLADLIQEQKSYAKALPLDKEQAQVLPETQLINQDSVTKRRTIVRPPRKNDFLKAPWKIIGCICILSAVAGYCILSPGAEKKESAEINEVNAEKTTAIEQLPASSPETGTVTPARRPAVDKLNPARYLEQATTSYNNGDYEKAILLYENYVSLSKTDNQSARNRIGYAKKCDALLKEANGLYANRAYREAIAIYKEILLINVSDENAKEKIRQCERMLTRPDE